jgi:hypothetical protein
VCGCAVNQPFAILKQTQTRYADQATKRIVAATNSLSFKSARIG